jgi:hypothetical protein
MFTGENMNPQLSVLAVTFISGGIISILGLALFSTVGMLRTARAIAEKNYQGLMESLHNQTLAEAERQKTINEFTEYKKQVSEWIKKPVQIEVGLSPEQMQGLAEAVKGYSNSSGDFILPRHTVKN